MSYELHDQSLPIFFIKDEAVAQLLKAEEIFVSLMRWFQIKIRSGMNLE